MRSRIYYTRTCALCDVQVHPTKITCRSCWPTYCKHKDEQWLQELVQIEMHNDKISRRETFTLFERQDLLTDMSVQYKRAYRETVLEYLKTHPNATIKQCADYFKISYRTAESIFYRARKRGLLPQGTRKHCTRNINS